MLIQSLGVFKEPSKEQSSRSHRITALHCITADDGQRNDHAAPRKSTLAPEDHLLQHRPQNPLDVSLTNTSSGISRLDKHLNGSFFGLQGVAASWELNGCIDGAQDIVASSRAFEGCRAVGTA